MRIALPGSAMLFIVFASAHLTGAGGVQRVCVVAVQDSSLFTLCPNTGMSSFTPDGRQHIRLFNSSWVRLPPHQLVLDRTILDAIRPDWPELARNWPHLCASGRIDVKLEQRLKKEFGKYRKEYVLVPSPEDADLIFLVEGFYHTFLTQRLGTATHGVLYTYGNTGPGEGQLQAALAIVVPADVYLRFPGNAGELLQAKLWGSSTWRPEPTRSAPVEVLVERFAKKRKNPADDLPLCAAWTLRNFSECTAGRPERAPALKVEPSGSTAQKEQAPGTGKEGAIAVNVTLVTVPVIAGDAEGRWVSDLAKSDFRLLENGMEQQIDQVIPEMKPFHVALMLDVSGSTLLKHAEIQNAAMAFLEALRPEDAAMVVSFADFIRVESEFTTDRKQLRSAILRTKTRNSTRLYDALDLVVQCRLDRIEGRKAIVLLTDGWDSASRLSDFTMTLARLQESDVLVYVVQYEPAFGIIRYVEAAGGQEERRQEVTLGLGKLVQARGSEFLNNLATNSGGRRFDAISTASLENAFGQIAEELRHYYTLCYYPSSPATDGAFRRIQVTLDRPGIKIRARTGYRPSP